MPGYEANFDARTIVYSIDAPDFSAVFEGQLLQDGFLPKDEFHITALSGEYAHSLTDEQFERAAHHLENREEIDYTFDRMVYHVVRPKVVEDVQVPRESLVVPATSRALVFDVMVASIIAGKLLTKPPFLHVTLATRPDTAIARRGIGIGSAEEWQRTERHIYRLGWQA